MTVAADYYPMKPSHLGRRWTKMDFETEHRATGDALKESNHG